jgi:hypothetical protein
VFWKGPHFVSSLHPREQSAAIRPAAGGVTCGPGESVTLEVSVTNTSATAWLREGRHGRGFVRLGAHLIGQDGTMLDHDYARASLPGDVPEHASASVALVLRAPDAPGRFTVRLDMVNEGIGWFAEGKSQTADVTLTVR